MAERLEYKLLGTKGGTLQAGYNLGYTIADNCQQIANIAEQSYRTEGTGAAAPKNKVSQFSYDANGNLLCINTGTKNGNKLLATNNRKLLWDEENRLLASCDNGFVTSYGYDASGERTYKMSGDGEGVNINGVVSGGRTATTNYTAYINPYMVARSGSEYTKHIYAGSQRIVSQICSYILNPLTAPKAGGADYSNQYNAQTAAIKARYDSVGIAYKGVNNAGANFFTAKTVTQENLQYFYHPDHLGSTSLITDLSGGLVQHLEYVPYGETFIDERRSASSWTTPYLFSAKERDDETGLYYYGARYYDPRTSVWVSVDPLAEKYMNIGSYVYCADNPVKYVDPDGRYIRWANYNLTDAQCKSFDSNQKYLSSKTRNALNLYMNSQEGYEFFAQFAKKGDKFGGHKFFLDGKYSDITLTVNEFTAELSNGVYYEKDGDVGVKFDENGNPSVELNLYPNGNTPEEEVVTLTEELQLHCSNLDNEFKNKKQSDQEPDHKALKNKDKTHSGYSKYSKLQTLFSAMSNKLKAAFNEADKENQKKYDNNGNTNAQ